MTLFFTYSVPLQFCQSLQSIQLSLNDVLIFFCIYDISKSYHTSCVHTRMVRKTSNLGQSKDKYLKDSTVTLLLLQYFHSSPFSITLGVAYSILILYQFQSSAVYFNFCLHRIEKNMYPSPVISNICFSLISRNQLSKKKMRCHHLYSQSSSIENLSFFPLPFSAINMNLI